MTSVVQIRLLSSTSPALNANPSFNFSFNQLFNSINSATSTTPKKKTPKAVVSHYKRSTHPTSVPLNKLFSNAFPLSIKESYQDYSFRNNPLKFQHDLLATLPFYPEPDASGKSSEVLQIPIDDKGNYINEFVIYPPGKSEADSASLNHLIMIHGYGGGLGFFLKNFQRISSVNNWCVHAIDLFGYGCSSRPPFNLAKEDLEHVENWFHDSFEVWMKKRKLGKFSPNHTTSPHKILIMAHSMGAYLMGSYGINRDPDFCDKMLMVSPGAILKHRKPVQVPQYFAKLWEQNISPFTLVRKAGPLGSKVVSGWSHRRFAKLSTSEATSLHKYAYGIFQSPGSGEYMLNYLLAPGADARFPLIERGIHKLNMHLSWWYGKEDWMDRKGGQLCSNIVNSYHNDNRSDVVEIEDSGHHIYLDNIDKFNEMLVKEMVALNK